MLLRLINIRIVCLIIAYIGWLVLVYHVHNMQILKELRIVIQYARANEKLYRCLRILLMEGRDALGDIRHRRILANNDDGSVVCSRYFRKGGLAQEHNV